MFIIEDARHAEPQEGEFPTLRAAIAELKRRAALPWNDAPNVPPYASWETCGRTYEIIEYDTTGTLWKEIRRIPFLEITSAGTKWLACFDEK